jgi:hypothetical protein
MQFYVTHGVTLPRNTAHASAIRSNGTSRNARYVPVRSDVYGGNGAPAFQSDDVHHAAAHELGNLRDHGVAECG